MVGKGCSMVFSDPKWGDRLNPGILKKHKGSIGLIVIILKKLFISSNSFEIFHAPIRTAFNFCMVHFVILRRESSHIPDFSPFKFESSQLFCIWEIASVFANLAICIYRCEMIHPPKKIRPQVIAPLPSLLFPFLWFFSIDLFTIKLGSVSSVQSTSTPTAPLHGKPWSPFEKTEHGGDEMAQVCKSWLVNQPHLTYPARNKGFKKARKRMINEPCS